jgi:hypothetical protein
MVAAIAVLVVLGGSNLVWAQCPASPSYSPDFSLNQSCMTLNSSANFPAIQPPAAITAWSGVGSTVTFTAVNSFTAGELITLSGFTTSTFFNGLSLFVNPDGLSSSQFEVTFSGFTGSGMNENGTATARSILQLTPAVTTQAGSAWFNTQQPVSGAFSTTFSFQLGGGNTSLSPADGIAFLIQNSPTTPAPGGLNALGPNGCGIGFGGDTLIGCTSGDGIANSLAIEFNTFLNNGIDPSNNDVTIQNCSGTLPNSVDPSCTIAVNANVLTAGLVTTSGTTVTWSSGTQFNTGWPAGTGILINGAPFVIANVASPTSLTVTVAPPTFSNPTSYSVGTTLADGNPHSVTVVYTPSNAMTCGENQTTNCSSIDVVLDGIDLFPGGVLFNLNTISLNNNNAWVGFTASTGGGDDNQDILSWTFTPNAQAAVVGTDQPSVLPFPNAAGDQVYDYNAQLNAPYPNPLVQIQPKPMDQATCNAIVQKSFWPAHCFVYSNAENSGLNAAVMFEVTCPLSPGGTCGSNTDQNFFAELGTDFEFSFANNPLFVYPGIFGLLNPFPGWLKGDSGPDPLHPCTPPKTGPLFQSNQVDTFFIDGGTTRGKGNGGASCWVATYDTPGELPPGIKITSPKPFATFTKGQQVTASYACNNPVTSKPITSPTGPYLTVGSCTQNSGVQNSCTPTNTGLACTGSVDTSSRGLHVFAVTAIDTGGNTNVSAVIYTVK